MKRLLLLLLVVSMGSSCAVVVRGSALSPRPHEDASLFLTTGGSPLAYETIGFIQVRGFGVEVAGLADVGDHAIDGAIHGALTEAARSMGGDGVINIVFLDENPSTPAERTQAAVDSVTSVATGEGEVETKNRYVRVTGEVIKFVGH